MKPTEKSKSIDGFLTSFTGTSRQKALQKNICVICRKPAKEFTDELSIKEYRISGMCQKCQDKTFGY